MVETEEVFLLDQIQPPYRYHNDTAHLLAIVQEPSYINRRHPSSTTSATVLKPSTASTPTSASTPAIVSTLDSALNSAIAQTASPVFQRVNITKLKPASTTLNPAAATSKLATASTPFTEPELATALKPTSTFSSTNTSRVRICFGSR
ncbi:hypothetical protein BDV98DRAFT_598529 [Pterulicium gracile]|uniref:Uncharacterized protein n=1 Tax=Pterulicium gracile TaxID=1884261 RepID=A0A5C3QAJ2_9AGAR|nr:hypothetical protein BDV98DRAFT_598529 [Pterula gracilis]